LTIRHQQSSNSSGQKVELNAAPVAISVIPVACILTVIVALLVMVLLKIGHLILRMKGGAGFAIGRCPRGGAIQFFIVFWMCQTRHSRGAKRAAVCCSQREPLQQALDFDLSASPVINNASITVLNEGADYLVLPAVFATGGYALNRSSILSAVQSAGSLLPE
jgi:hypothetical protein